MEDLKKKTVKKGTNKKKRNSSVKKTAVSKKKEFNSIDSSELMDKILSKKKNRNSNNTKSKSLNETIHSFDKKNNSTIAVSSKNNKKNKEKKSVVKSNSSTLKKNIVEENVKKDNSTKSISVPVKKKKSVSNNRSISNKKNGNNKVDIKKNNDQNLKLEKDIKNSKNIVLSKELNVNVEIDNSLSKFKSNEKSTKKNKDETSNNSNKSKVLVVNRDKVDNSIVKKIIDKDSEISKISDNSFDKVDVDDLKNSNVVIKDNNENITSDYSLNISNNNNNNNNNLSKDTGNVINDDIYDTIDRKVDLILTDSKIKREFDVKYIMIALLFLITFVFVVLLLVSDKGKVSSVSKVDSVKNEVVVANDEEKDLELINARYESCINEVYNDSDDSENMLKVVEDLDEYIRTHYSASVAYVDLTNGFEYHYNPNQVYYAASTIKSLDALYIYQQASNGELSLDDTITYTSKYKWGSSAFMKDKKYGDKISLRDLVKYAVIVSDNSAHQMLISYIGYDNLKKFGKSLGAEYTLTSSDNFGNLSANDGIVYMNAINDFINSSGDLGEELKSYFVQAEQNDLELPDLGIKAAHKYGQYNEIYHDIGIVYDEHPYLIAVLTKEGKKDFENIVRDINKHVYLLHTSYISNRFNYCHELVYEQ